MNKLLVGLCLLAALYIYWDKLPFSPAPEPFATTYTGEIALYATQWCGYCAKTRKFFDKNNIKFTEYDVENSDDAKQRFISMEGRGVPLIVIGDTIIRGYDLDAIKAALSKP